MLGHLVQIAKVMLATPISGATDAILTKVLRDESVLDDLLKENRSRLAKAFVVLVRWCEFHAIPYGTLVGSDMLHFLTCAVQL